MRIRNLITLAILAIAIALPGVSLAKTKKGIGKGGVPAMRDQIYTTIDELEIRLQDLIGTLEGRVAALEGTVEDLEARVADLEGQLADDDGDGFTEAQGDCDDANAAANPGETEKPATDFDDDCDGTA